jgi:hypothetical protein
MVSIPCGPSGAPWVGYPARSQTGFRIESEAGVPNAPHGEADVAIYEMEPGEITALLQRLEEQGSCETDFYTSIADRDADDGDRVRIRFRFARAGTTGEAWYVAGDGVVLHVFVHGPAPEAAAEVVQLVIGG